MRRHRQALYCSIIYFRYNIRMLFWWSVHPFKYSPQTTNFMKVYVLRNFQRINALTMLFHTCSFYCWCRAGNLTFPHSPIGKKYSNDVAIEWINLQQKMTLRTPGFGPGPAGRAFAYSGVTMYESVLPAITGFHGFIISKVQRCHSRKEQKILLAG